MHRLHLLGRIDLYDPKGAAVRRVLAQPKRLAMLAYLCLCPRGVACRRDTLHALLWPEFDQERARKALNKGVHFLRRELGADALVSRSSEDLAVDNDRMWCDAAAFADAAASGREAEAIELYRGELLPAFHLADAPEFENWLETERARLQRVAARAARRLAEHREQEGQLTTAVRLARHAVDLSGQDERAVRQLLELLDRSGDRAGAIRAYEEFARRLTSEYDAQPAAETRDLVARIRGRETSPDAARIAIAVASPSPASTPYVATTLFGAVRARGYAIERELGRGGMATVYLARDLKHDREVAVKVLAPAVGALHLTERFLAEIRVTASLRHPNILPLFDSGEVDGVPYYVMPYVDGESLRARLRRQGRLPIDDALALIRTLAGALAYAHAQGIVHRDIKPENILLHAGQPMLADFGIALALSGWEAERLTTTGLSLGTPQYMSPEHAAGDGRVGPASDVYSLAAVAYEVLVGKPPFTGPNARAVLARVMLDAPRALHELREAVPAHIEAAVLRGLAKRPEDRFAAAADFAHALEDAEAGAVSIERSTPSAVRRQRTRWWLAPTVIAAALLLGWRVSPRMHSLWLAVSNGETAVRRLTIVLPDSAPLAAVDPSEETAHHALAIAPDASVIAYVAQVGNETMLYTRRIDDARVQPVPGTQGAHSPFFSPDGSWIAYFAGTKLYKVAVQGGRPVLLADVGNPLGGTWLPDGRLLVDRGGLLALVPEQGGTAVLIPRRGSGSMVYPSGFVAGLGSRWATAEFWREISFLTFRDTVRRLALVEGGKLMPADYPPRPTGRMFGLGPSIVAGEYLVYAQSGGDGVVLAAPFDTARMQATGVALPVLDDVRIDRNIPQYAAASDGTLAYVVGGNGVLSRFVLRDRAGKTDTIPSPKSDVAWLALSRDGQRVVHARWNPGVDVQYVVTDLATGLTTQLPDSLERVIWAPDSRSLFATKRVGGGRRRVTLRMSPATGQVVDTILRDGSIFSVDTAETVFAVKSRGGKPTSIVWKDSTRPAAEVPDRLGNVAFGGGSTLASLSPSGKWIAITGISDGSMDIFVAPTAHPDALVRITREGGRKPLWNADESEIVYRNHRSWYAVPISTKGELRVGKPRLLFGGAYLEAPGYSHALMPDGRRHLLLVGPADQTARRIEVILGWKAALRRLTTRMH